MTTSLEPVRTDATYRVLQVLPDLRFGGGQQSVLALAAATNGDRLRQLVCYLRPQHDLAESFRAAGIETFCLDHEPGKSARTIARLVKLVRSEHIDLLHTHSSLDRHFAYAAAIACRVPVVSHIRVTRNARGPSLPEQRSLRATLARASAGARGLVRYATWWLVVRHYIAVSYAARDAQPRLPAPVSVISNIIDIDRFDVSLDDEMRVALREELDLGSGPLVLTVGRLSLEKGHRYLVTAMREVVARFPSARLALVGDGTRRAEIEDQVRSEGLTSCVWFLGNRADVPTLLALADVVVLPSLSEGFGRVAVEAMAAGKPLVASRLPALEEMVDDGQTGLLADVADPSALAESICALLADPVWATDLGRRGRAAVRTRFATPRLAAELSDVYASVLAEPRRRGARR